MVLAVYTGVEPVSGDRQSPILAVRRIDHWFRIRELDPVHAAYETAIDTDLPPGILVMSPGIEPGLRD